MMGVGFRTFVCAVVVGWVALGSGCEDTSPPGAGTPTGADAVGDAAQGGA